MPAPSKRTVAAPGRIRPNRSDLFAWSGRGTALKRVRPRAASVPGRWPGNAALTPEASEPGNAEIDVAQVPAVSDPYEGASNLGGADRRSPETLISLRPAPPSPPPPLPPPPIPQLFARPPVAISAGVPGAPGTAVRFGEATP